MSDGSVRNFYIPTEVTDYADPLSKVYERQSRQTKQWLEDQLEHSRQIEAADGGKTALATAKQFLQTASAVGSAVKAGKARGKAKEEKTDKKTKAALTALITNPDEQKAVQEIAKKFRSKEKGFKYDHKGYKEIVEKQFADGKISIDTKDYLLKASPAEQLSLRKHVLIQRTSQGYNAFNDFQTSEAALEEKGKKEKKPYTSKYQTYLTDAGGNKESAYKKWFVEDYMKDYGLTIESAGALLIPEVNRQGSTAAGTAKAHSTVKSETTRALNFRNNLETAIGEVQTDSAAPGSGNPNAITELLVDGLNEFRADFKAKGFSDEASSYKAKRKLRGLLSISIDARELNSETLDALEDGIVEGVPMGTGLAKEAKGLMFLEESDFTFLRTRLDGVNSAIAAEKIVEAKSLLINTKARMSKGDASVKDMSLALSRAKSLGLTENSKEYKSAANFNPIDQTPEKYEEQMKDLQLFMSSNAAQRKAILADKTNDNAYNKYSEIDAKLTKEKKLLVLDDDGKKLAINLVKGDNELALDSTTTLSELKGQNALATHIQREWQPIINNEILISESGDSTITQRAIDKLKLKLASQGFGIPADDPRAGILSRTSEGEYPGLKIQGAVKNEAIGHDIAYTINEASHAFAEHKGTKNDFIRSGKGLSNSEVIALLGEYDNETKTFKKWPPDIIRKCEIYGIQPEVLVKAKIQQMINDKNNEATKILVTAYALDKLDLNTLPQGELNVRKFIEKGLSQGGKHTDFYAHNLLHALEYQRIENWPPNTFKQLMELERRINNFGETASPNTDQILARLADSSESYDYDINPEDAKALQQLNEAELAAVEDQIGSNNETLKRVKEKLGLNN